MTIKQLVSKYNKYVEDYEIDEEWTERYGEQYYWVYLRDGYLTDDELSSIHDDLQSIKWELEDIAKKYK